MSPVNPALEPWLVSASTFPARGTLREQLRHLVRYAVLAPSTHNSQPWRFVIGNGTIDLYADPTRGLPVVDPRQRELVMSCGAALFFLRAAARRFGFAGELVPVARGADRDLLATFTLGPPHRTSDDDRALCDAMMLRRTSRFSFEEASLPERLVHTLGDSARSEGAWLHEVAGDRRHVVASLVAEADRMQHHDPAFRAELAGWLRGDDTRRDGMPGYAHHLTGFGATVAPLIVRSFDIGRGRAAADRELVSHAGLIAVLGTAGDARADWLAAGQALGHVLLRATIAGVSASFLNQAVEVPILRRGLELGLGLGGAAQLVMRLGYGPLEVRPTPRRSIDEVIIG